MKVIDDIKDWDAGATAATIGFFDGVHLGHRYLLAELRRLAAMRGLPSAVITFSRHPRIVLQSDYQPKMLNSFDEKIELLAETGADYAFIMDFTSGLAALSADKFIKDILRNNLNIKMLLIGYDHRFGYKRAEGFEKYAEYGSECGIEVVSASSFSNAGAAVSSSAVRRYIEAGNVAMAARLLGYDYRLKGHVVGGAKIGRSIGFPTANIAVDEAFKVIPLHGSYAVWVVIDGRYMKGMLYVGSRPTVDDGVPSIEVNIFDFSDDIYGKEVMVEFVEFVRSDEKFASLEELAVQMMKDKSAVDKILDEKSRYIKYKY